MTLDDDFADDRRCPFTHGMIAGIIIVRASSSAPPAIVGLLAMLLDFVIIFPFPRGLLLDTKFIATQQGVTMQGRNAATKEIKTMRITPRRTTIHEIRLFFGYRPSDRLVRERNRWFESTSLHRGVCKLSVLASIMRIGRSRQWPHSFVCGEDGADRHGARARLGIRPP